MINCIATTLGTLLAVVLLRRLIGKVRYYASLPKEVSSLKWDLGHEKRMHEITAEAKETYKDQRRTELAAINEEHMNQIRALEADLKNTMTMLDKRNRFLSELRVEFRRGAKAATGDQIAVKSCTK